MPRDENNMQMTQNYEGNIVMRSIYMHPKTENTIDKILRIGERIIQKNTKKKMTGEHMKRFPAYVEADTLPNTKLGI